MAKVRAAVLAAGRGVRMGGLRPKTLLPLVEDKPLLWHMLHGLREASVTEVIIVTGFKSDEVAAFADAHAGGLDLTYVFNARYASWGNFHSLRMALEQSPGYSVLAVNSDIVVAPDVYARALSSEGDVVLTVQRRRVLDEEDMRVRLSGGRVLAIGKDLKMAHSHGEFTGISLLRPEAARRYLDIASDLEWTGATGIYYEDVYARMLPDVDARAVPVEAGEYAEVDTPGDVDAAVAVLRRRSQATA